MAALRNGGPSEWRANTLATGRPIGPIIAVNGSNDAPSRRSRPLYGFVNKNISLFSPENVKNCITPYGNSEEL